MRVKTCTPENTVKIGKRLTMNFWDDGSISLEDQWDEGLDVTPKNIELAYIELVRRKKIKTPKGAKI